MALKNNNNEDKLLEVFDINESIKQLKDKKLSADEVNNFINSIMQNYFLDNDNINFLEQHGLAFFYFDDNELCICNSKKKFMDCHKLKLKPKSDTEYVTYEKTINEQLSYQNYLNNNEQLKKQILDDYLKNISCIFLDCKNKCIKNQIVNDPNLLTTLKEDFIDTKLTIGDSFFTTDANKVFFINNICKEHYKILNTDKYNNNYEIIKASAFNLERKTLLFNFALSEYEHNFNSINENGYKALMIYHLRMLSKNLNNAVKNNDILVNDYKNNDFSNWKNISYQIKSKKNPFYVNSFFYPQILLNDFFVINPVNNPLVDCKSGFINTHRIDNSTIKVTISWHKDEVLIDKFMQEWIEKLNNNKKSVEYFASNVSLILTDDILFYKEYYDKLNNDEKILYSALSKFRLETPKPGQEYIKMKFFNGFDLGNNFFK